MFVSSATGETGIYRATCLVEKKAASYKLQVSEGIKITDNNIIKKLIVLTAISFFYLEACSLGLAAYFFMYITSFTSFTVRSTSGRYSFTRLGA